VHLEVTPKELVFRDWAGRAGVTGQDLIRLKVMLERAPAEVLDFLRPSSRVADLGFQLSEMILVLRRRSELLYAGGPDAE
jgi:hypothetical protein